MPVLSRMTVEQRLLTLYVSSVMVDAFDLVFSRRNERSLCMQHVQLTCECMCSQRLPEAAQAASERAAGQNFAARGQINGCMLCYAVMQQCSHDLLEAAWASPSAQSMLAAGTATLVAGSITDMVDLSFTTTVTWYITDMLDTDMLDMLDMLCTKTTDAKT